MDPKAVQRPLSPPDTPEQSQTNVYRGRYLTPPQPVGVVQAGSGSNGRWMFGRDSEQSPTSDNVTAARHSFAPLDTPPISPDTHSQSAPNRFAGLGLSRVNLPLSTCSPLLEQSLFEDVETLASSASSSRASTGNLNDLPNRGSFDYQPSPQIEGSFSPAYPNSTSPASRNAASSFAVPWVLRARELLRLAHHHALAVVPSSVLRITTRNVKTPKIPAASRIFSTPGSTSSPLDPRRDALSRFRRVTTGQIDRLSPRTRLGEGPRQEKLSLASPIQNIQRAVQSISPSYRGPKRSRTRARRLLLILAFCIVAYYLISLALKEGYNAAARRGAALRFVSDTLREQPGKLLSEYKQHPISALLDQANKAWIAKVKRQSQTPEQAIIEYKRRYGRSPPEGFKEWFEYAKSKGTVLPDEYDSLMASLEPFWALDAAEIRRRTFLMGLQPSFAIVHVEAGVKGGTYWDANEDEALIKRFGIQRALGFERMIRPFASRPGMRNMAFAVNELAEPRVLVSWEEQQLIREALQNQTTITKQQTSQLPSRSKKFFPSPVWQGDGTTWEIFKRTCPPGSAARRIITTMTEQIIHEADVKHVAYAANFTRPHGRRKRSNIIADLIDAEDRTELQVNPARSAKRRVAVPSPPSGHLAFDRAIPRIPSKRKSLSQTLKPKHLSHGNSPLADYIPKSNKHMDTPAFRFNNNLTTVSHKQLCEDSRTHDTQGQFCSDFRSLDALYPIFSPSTMAGFSDIVIPSHYYASESPKYHLDAHIKRVKKAVKDPETGLWSNVLAPEDLPKWEDRQNKIFWRGSATGGGNNPAGRQLTYQRHRFVKLASSNSSQLVAIVLPSQNGSDGLTYVELPERVANRDVMDVAFTSLEGCGHKKVCAAVKNGAYTIGERVPLIDIVNHKLLADIDGMAYSARFMALFESRAAVMKSTIYTEYFADQIQPWYHFIPFSMTYDEVYNIYSYFLGSAAQKLSHVPIRRAGFKVKSTPWPMMRSNEGIYEARTGIAAPANRGANEDSLRAIAEQGHQWQKDFGKKVHMEIYCYRLALEWARLWTRDGSDGFTTANYSTYSKDE